MRSKFSGVIVAAASIVLFGTARAGTVELHDSAAVIDDAALSTIREAAVRWPFDLRVVTTTSTRQELQSTVRLGVTGPSVVCVGLQPLSKFVHVQWGTNVRVRAGEWQAIYAAGNESFTLDRWAEGVVRVADAVRTRGQWSRQDLADFDVEPPPEDLSRAWLLQWIVMLGLGVALILALIRIARAAWSAPDVPSAPSVSPPTSTIR